ncbi:MAG TPA: hypothetical protein VF631_01525 [Allosphingosinicella sp.]|jgi:hypothetical protein|uniref:hypothetical protein n=1 Tax=Allosphingosinicella sp. TaxID=2823234 RepID=UPI002F29283F
MRKISKVTGIASYCALFGACALGSGMAPLFCGGADPEGPTALGQGVASGPEEGWFLLDSGFGYEGFPTFYRLDGGVVSELIFHA